MCGNVWECNFDNIRRGYWCAKCAGCKKATIKDMQQIAEKYNGECLSDTYINAHQKLKWHCFDCDRIWEEKSNCIKNKIRKFNIWCSKCGRKEKDESRAS